MNKTQYEKVNLMSAGEQEPARELSFDVEGLTFRALKLKDGRFSGKYVVEGDEGIYFCEGLMGDGVQSNGMFFEVKLDEFDCIEEVMGTGMKNLDITIATHLIGLFLDVYMTLKEKEETKDINMTELYEQFDILPAGIFSLNDGHRGLKGEAYNLLEHVIDSRTVRYSNEVKNEIKTEKREELAKLINVNLEKEKI